MPPPTLRGAMIGLGVWGAGQLDLWSRVASAHIVAACDQNSERLQAGADRGYATYADASTMLAAEALDFVDICTRPASHAPLIRLCAGRVPAILCQKPFCTSLEEAADIVALCAQRGSRLMINENFRWQAWYRTIRQLLEDGAVGDPFFARIHWRLRTTLPVFAHAQAYFKDMPRLAVYELGVHYIDVFRFLFGEPSTVYARLQRVSPEIAGEDIQNITLAYTTPNLTCQINHSWASVAIPEEDAVSGEDRLEIAHPLEIDGTQGTLVLRANRSLHRYADSAHETWTFPRDARMASQLAALQHFIDCVTTGTDFETSGQDNLRTLSALYACYESAATNQVIHLSKAP